jgi:putative ABC transport system permease protein
MSLIADARQAWRSLRRTPTFTVTAIVTLALGIGANAAIFSVVDAVLLKPLPYQESDRLVAVAELPPSGLRNSVSAASFFGWQAAATSFESMAARQSVSTTVLGLAAPAEVRAARVTTGYFDVLGVGAARGRTFSESDGQSGAPCVAVIADRSWTTLWARDPAIIGSAIRLADGECVVAGVLPADSVFDRVPIQIYLPFQFTAETAPNGHYLSVTARLRDDASVESARSEMQVIAPAVAGAQPGKQDWSAAVDPLQATVVRADTRRLVLVLFGAVAVVLLVAVVNVGGLGLSRASQRQREVSIRLALGAGSRRLFRYFLVESLLLSALGGGLGVLLGYWMVRALTTIMPPGTLPTEAAIALDARVFAFLALLVVFISALVAAAPALQAIKGAASDALRKEGRSATLSRGTRRSQDTLVVMQIALAMVLVTSATLLVTSFTRLTRVDPGFDPAGVTTFRLAVPTSVAEAQWSQIHGGIIDELGRLAGVEAVGAATSLPLRGWLYGTSVRVEGVAPTEPTRMNAHVQHVRGRYFEALRIPLEEGRYFTDADQTANARVAIVNHTFLRRFIGAGAGVGHRLRLGISDDDSVSWEVIGVVADLKTGGLADADLRTPEVYVPHAAAPAPTLSYVVRAAGPPPSVRTLQEVVQRVDPDRPLTAYMTMEDLVGDSVVGQRFRTWLVTGFAAVSLLLAVIGVYSVRTQAVAARRRELGIRLALGATRQQVMRLVVGQGGVLVGLGVALGLAGGLLAAGAIEQWLFAVESKNPGPLVIALLVLGSAGLVASWVPARRAAAVPPAEALRHE